MMTVLKLFELYIARWKPVANKYTKYKTDIKFFQVQITILTFAELNRLFSKRTHDYFTKNLCFSF